MSTRAGIALIIPTFRREAVLVECLQSVLAQDLRAAEVVVVDQTPEHEPATAAFLAAQAASIRVVRQEEPSLTRARNRGAAETTAAELVFIDDDTLLPPGFLAAYAAAFAAGATVVQGGIREPGEGPPAAAPPWFSHLGRWSGGCSCPRAGRTNLLTGANFGLTRAAHARVGPFDEGFAGVALREDSDYGLRCHAAGEAIRFAPECGLFHRREPSGGVDAHLAKGLIDPRMLACEVRFAERHLARPWRDLYLWRVRRRCARTVRKAMQRLRAGAAR